MCLMRFRKIRFLFLLISPLFSNERYNNLIEAEMSNRVLIVRVYEDISKNEFCVVWLDRKGNPIKMLYLELKGEKISSLFRDR